MASIGTTFTCCTSIGHAGKEDITKPVKCPAENGPLGSRVSNQHLAIIKSRWRPKHNGGKHARRPVNKVENR